jgi:hypothetical protein
LHTKGKWKFMAGMLTTHVGSLARVDDLVPLLLARDHSRPYDAPDFDRRVQAAIVGLERVIASTDCGFGTFAGYGEIDPAVTWKKLRALRVGADLAAAR